MFKISSELSSGIYWDIIVDNNFTRQYIPEDNSEHHTRRRENLKSSKYLFHKRAKSRPLNTKHFYWNVTFNSPSAIKSYEGTPHYIVYYHFRKWDMFLKSNLIENSLNKYLFHLRERQ
jgi:hypothetical protein